MGLPSTERPRRKRLADSRAAAGGANPSEERREREISRAAALGTTMTRPLIRARSLELPRSSDRRTGVSGAIVAMSARVRAVRGQGTLVAIGFPSAAVLAVVLWLEQHGAGLDTSIPAAVVLVALTALAEQIYLVVEPRMSVSSAGAFIVAAGLVGGPLLGACAGASIETFTVRDVWRKRSTYGGAGALQGFVV